MVYFSRILLFTLALQFLHLISSVQSKSPNCKASLGSPDWPSLSKWAALNATISGRLLQPSPPAAACHPEMPEYNATNCATVLDGWYTLDMHTLNPISSVWNNWNNDSCLPTLPSPCSGEGYPVYVVNATTPQHVKTAVDFARANNVRLNIKSTGHDYMGRSVSPNTLSIWTYHLQDITTSKSGFQPEGCEFTIEGASLTAGGGTRMAAANIAANKEGLYILSGGSDSVSFGGYITGGGHAALSSTLGLGTDNVLQFEIVSPTGQILKINECQNRDVFWATRGGGGSTFGVITSLTVRAWPEFNFLDTVITIGTVASDPSFYPAMAYFFSQFPQISDHGITSYNALTANSSEPIANNPFPGIPTINGTAYASFQGVFMLPVLNAQNTSSSLTNALKPILANLSAQYPHFIVSITNVTTNPTFFKWWYPADNPNNAGADFVVGSRLIGREALANVSAVEKAVKGVMTQTLNPGGFTFYLLGGNGLKNVVPRGGSDAVNPAWRKAIVHAVTGTSWTAFNKTEEQKVTTGLTKTSLQYLRDLDPDSGAYVNEANKHEPNWQQAFWGDNYERLLKIKRKVDPDTVFWCTPCVGSEGWEMVGNTLCKV